MGMFSWMCKGSCGKPITQGEEIIQIKGGDYGGYGDMDSGEYGIYFHKKCFVRQFGEIDMTAADSDRDQGMGYPDPEFVPEGTVLFDAQYDVLKGVEKVGVCIDVSGGMVFDMLRGGQQMLSGAEAAMHYLGTKEVEAMSFDFKVLKRETMPADKLHSVIYDHDGSWRQGGGGTDFGPPIAAAVKAGCGAIIMVTDLLGPFPADPGVPVIWLCSVSPALIDANHDAGRKAYDGVEVPPFGSVQHFESYAD